MGIPDSRKTRTARTPVLPEPPPSDTELRPHRLGSDRSRAWAIYEDDAGKTAWQTLAGYVCDPSNAEQIEAKRRAEEYSRTFNDRFDAGEGAVFYGTVGTGKDHLAGALGRRAVYLGYGVRWIHAGEWYTRFRDGMGSGRQWETIDEIATPEVLVLSEVARPMEPLTPMVAEGLLVALDKRIRKGRLTLCTLNAASPEAAIDLIGAAAWERLIDGAWMFRCIWESCRQSHPGLSLESNRTGGAR